MTDRKYTDADEEAALRAGASALRLRAELISNRTNRPEPPDVRAVMDAWTRSADVLLEMADCYGPVVRDPEAWQAVAEEGRRFA